jgi:hypothetical protein
VNYLVRATIQTGSLATTWAISALVTWFFLPNISAFRFFDITGGAVYAYVSDAPLSDFLIWRRYQAIFDTLLSRVKLRERMSSTVYTMQVL